jgi:hypothetical protein
MIMLTAAVTNTASGDSAPTQSGAVLRLGLTNWTRFDASGKGCGAKWGGLGGGDTGTRLRWFEIPLTGDDTSWAETFRYTTYQSGGDLLKGTIPDWPGWNDPNATVTNEISETYRVSRVVILPCDALIRSVISTSGASWRRTQM